MPSDDQTKNSWLFAILAFNLTIILFYLLYLLGLFSLTLFYILAIIFAIPAAVGGFFAGKTFG